MLDILYTQPIYARVITRGDVGDRLIITSIHDERAVWANRIDGYSTSLGLLTLGADYYFTGNLHGPVKYRDDVDLLNDLISEMRT